MSKLAWCLLVFTVLAVHAQTHSLAEWTGNLQSGVTAKLKTMVERSPKTAEFQLKGGVFRATGDSMVHCIYDAETQSYFGYEMTVWPGDEPGTRRVTIGPPGLAAVLNGLKAVAGDLPLNPAPPPKYPEPQIVHNGDTLAMDIMVSSDGRGRIVDYLKFSFGVESVKPAAETAMPQDLTLDDGPVNWNMNETKVRIDGVEFPGTVVVYASRGGATPWFYFPGQGRYILSLAPHEGLQRAGTVRASVISFTAGGHDYEIRLMDPVAGLEKAWNLYVGRDPGYLPRPALLKTVTSSVDRLENLVKK